MRWLLKETHGVRVCTLVNDYAERFDVENITSTFTDAGLLNANRSGHAYV